MISYLVLALYLGAHVYLYYDNSEKKNKSLEHILFTLSVYILTDLGPRFASKSLTFSESFTLATLLTVYAGYSLKSIYLPVLSAVGNPLLNAAMFAPWLSVGLFLGLMLPLSRVLRSSIAFFVAFVTMLVVFALFYFQSGAVWRIIVILKHPENILMISYLAMTLACGLFLLYDLSNHVDE